MKNEKIMIHFKPLQLSDKKAIDACLQGNTYRACDFCFANLYAWQAKFKTTFAAEQDTLFIRWKDDEDEFCYTMPVGKMPLEKALKLMLQDASENQIPFILKGITLRMWDDIEKAMPGVFDYRHDSCNDEYIYFSKRLIELSGRKLQSKRNHINRFKKENPDWHYVPLASEADLRACGEMLDEWENLNLSKAEKSLRYDYIASKIMLENYEYLGLRGAALKAKGRIAAFTLGERLTDDTFVVHVEKAYSGMNGAYALINQQFVAHEAAKYTYINREEDMGLEYLRKAKQSYYPDMLLQERILRVKEGR